MADRDVTIWTGDVYLVPVRDPAFIRRVWLNCAFIERVELVSAGWFCIFFRDAFYHCETNPLDG